MMPTKTGDKPTPEQTKALLTLVSDIYNSIAIGTTEIHDIAVKIDKDGKKAAFGFTRLALNDMANARFGEIALDGFNVEAPDAHVKLGTFAIRGFNFKSTLDAFQLMSLDDPNPVKNLNPRVLIPTVDQIVVAGVDADVPDEHHQGNSSDGSRDVFKIGKVEFNGSNYLLGIPTAFSFLVDHVVADLPANDPNVKQFIALGYQSLDLSSKFEMAWNEAGSELALKELSMTGTGMAAVKLTGVFRQRHQGPVHRRSRRRPGGAVRRRDQGRRCPHRQCRPGRQGLHLPRADVGQVGRAVQDRICGSRVGRHSPGAR